jgi:hypothetical protein
MIAPMNLPVRDLYSVDLFRKGTLGHIDDSHSAACAAKDIPERLAFQIFLLEARRLVGTRA